MIKKNTNYTPKKKTYWFLSNTQQKLAIVVSCKKIQKKKQMWVSLYHTVHTILLTFDCELCSSLYLYNLSPHTIFLIPHRNTVYIVFETLMQMKTKNDFLKSHNIRHFNSFMSLVFWMFLFFSISFFFFTCIFNIKNKIYSYYWEIFFIQIFGKAQLFCFSP